MDKLVSKHRYFHWLYYNRRRSHLFNISLTLFQWLFLAILQPLGIYNHTLGSYWALLFTLLIVCSLWLAVIYAFKAFGIYYPNHIKKDLIRWAAIYVVVSNLFCLHQSYACDWLCMSWKQYFEYYIANGVIFLIVYTVFAVYARANYYRGMLESEIDEKQLVLTEAGSRKIKVAVSDLLFFKADDNYVEIYIKTSNGFRKELFRQTLKNIQDQLKNQEHFARIHRSYLVNLSTHFDKDANLRHITYKAGDASWTLPVSKNYRPLIQDHLTLNSLP